MNRGSCDDGKSCTKNDRCSSGRCSGSRFFCKSCEYCHDEECEIKDGYCVISERCYTHGQTQSSNRCKVYFWEEHKPVESILKGAWGG